MKASLKNYRHSPRKVRKVTDLVKGKAFNAAVAELDRLPKRAAFPVRKLIMSAAANAAEKGTEKENLFIKDIRVDEGTVLKRMVPRAMGRGVIIKKRSSRISVLLGEKSPARSEGKNNKKKMTDKIKKIGKKHE